MKYFLVFLLLHGVLGHYRFGESYLENSLLCKPWTCIDHHLNLDTPPTQANYTAAIKSLVTAEWYPAVENAVGICFGEDKPRRYTNTCPGQAMLHCLVDNLIENCPESRLKKDDACAPVSSLAGFKYMFSQSRYENLEKYLPTERRPVWFLQNYFSTKCCDLPQIFDNTVLTSCGFNSLIHYYGHEPKPKINFLPVADSLKANPPFSSSTPTPEKVNIADLATVDSEIQQALGSPKPTPEAVRVVEVAEVDDLMSCCDLSTFVPPQARMDCNFATTWDPQNRLGVLDKEPNPEHFAVTTTTTTPLPPVKHHDVKVVPLNCQSEICVFSELNITTTDGKVNKDEFSKLLDNWTKKHPEWSSAKARVVTTCLTRRLYEYKNECELDSVLGCVFDVLSENCPSNKKTVKDPCKHVHEMKDDTICRINASKYRPKNRRLFCDFPNFVDHKTLAKCNVSSIYKIESAPEVFKKPWFKRRLDSKPSCKESTKSSLCLMSKMGVLNKYNFMDYFKMMDRIRQFTTNQQLGVLEQVYMSSFNSMPMYRDHCASQRKLLNVFDAMIMTCPVSKRLSTPKCNKMFKDISHTEAMKDKVTQMLNDIFAKFPPTSSEKKYIGKRIPESKKMHPILGYGIFGKNKIPKVEIMPIKPQILTKENRKPLIVLPVNSRSSTPSPNTPIPTLDDTKSQNEPKTPESSTQTEHIPITPLKPQYRPGLPPLDMQKNTAMMNLLDRFRYPREFPDITPNPFYGPFHQDDLLRGGIKFERPFTNAHSGNDLDTDFAKPE